MINRSIVVIVTEISGLADVLFILASVIREK